MPFANGWLMMSFLAAASSAQPPSIGAQETTRARLLLHSTRWVDKAWGAYFAGRLHSTDLAVDILDEFRASGILSAASPSSEEHAFIAALFDAAIESGVQVHAAVLDPFEGGWDEQVLVLLALSRARDREDSLLRLSDARPDMAWSAANNLLFGMKSRKWYVKTLGELSITQRFTVIDPDSVPPNVSGTGGGDCGDGMTQIPKGFPPIALYTLQSTPGTGLVLLAPGPVDVYYRRTVVPTDQQTGFGSCFSVNRMKVRIGYLAALAKMSAEEAEKLFHCEALIRYKGVEQFQSAIQQSMELQEQGIRGLIQAVQQRERLSGSGVVLQIVPEVNDQRQNRTDPLPTVPPRGIVLN
jgi:hypothetical protein